MVVKILLVGAYLWLVTDLGSWGVPNALFNGVVLLAVLHGIGIFTKRKYPHPQKASGRNPRNPWILGYFLIFFWYFQDFWSNIRVFN